MIAAAFPGRLGDFLWQAPTFKAISERHESPIHIITSEYCYGPSRRLIQSQSWVESFEASPSYVVENDLCGFQPWEMPIDKEFDKVYQLGFRSYPKMHLSKWSASFYDLEPSPEEFQWHIKPFEKAMPPYIVCSPDAAYIAESDYTKAIVEFGKAFGLNVVQVGKHHNHFEGMLDMRDADLLDTARIMASAQFFLGHLSANAVLANFIPTTKIIINTPKAPNKNFALTSSQTVIMPYNFDRELLYVACNSVL